ncbi:MAG: hypothetical protein JSW60_08735 [Thermoplasmatales archaeon]|nr:MAG: hypothetical protein JSW60_08735 [Thermoplasmatales archaeon]
MDKHLYQMCIIISRGRKISSNEMNRPVGVTILIIIFMLGALNSIIRFFDYSLRIANEGFSITIIFLLIELIFIVIFILLAYGFIKGIRWSWNLAVIMCIIWIFFYSALLISFTFQDFYFISYFEFFPLLFKFIYIGVSLFFAGLLIYLIRPKVIQYFNKGLSGFFSSVKKMNLLALVVVGFIIVVAVFSFIWPLRPYIGDISISDFHYVPSDAQPGDLITFYVTIENLPSNYSVYLMEQEFCNGVEQLGGRSLMYNVNDSVFEGWAKIPVNISLADLTANCESNAIIEYWVGVYSKSELYKLNVGLGKVRPTASSKTISFSLS